MWLNYIAVAVGGAFGCTARYGLTQLIQLVWGRNFPTATLVINVLGSFILGFLFFETLERLTMAPALRAAILTGGLGGFTTFSTFMVESVLLVEDGRPGGAFLYLVLSIVLGLTAAVAGGLLSRRL
ncbi:MAG: fluoride efflux transporter CrcB [Gammaproteobacteria bacterium]